MRRHSRNINDLSCRLCKSSSKLRRQSPQLCNNQLLEPHSLLTWPLDVSISLVLQICCPHQMRCIEDKDIFKLVSLPFLVTTSAAERVFRLLQPTAWRKRNDARSDGFALQSQGPKNQLSMQPYSKYSAWQVPPLGLCVFA